jgi:penicillin-binding protein 2
MPLFDRKDKSRYATFSRRTLMMGGGVGMVLTALGARLYQLQIVEGDQFRTKAEENSINKRLLAPLRGRIVDRFGVELANNKKNYRVVLVPEEATGGVEAALDTIGRIILIAPHERERILREIAANKKFMPAVVAENLTWQEYSLVNLHLPYLSGVRPEVGETRDYPFGDVLSHVLGYVAAVSPDDMKNDSDQLLSLPGFRIGKRGIEKAFDSQVRGAAGVSEEEVNAYGRVIRELGREPGEPGSDVYLTVDQQVQQFAVQRIGGESAACVVMDITNGDVLALVSTPGFDPNLFNVGITPDQWHALTTNDHTPLINKAISGIYPPGSTFKPTVALGALDSGAITPDFNVVCSGTYQFGNYTFHCWKHDGHGRVDLHRGIAASCDVFFYHVADRMGIDAIEAVAHKVGLGKLTHIEIPGEQPGVIPGRAWKLAKFGVPWQKGETLNTGIGQGYVSATPIQLCTAAARIASGNAVTPRITRVVGRAVQDRPELNRLQVTDASLQAVQAGMNAVCNEPGGTAYPWRITEPGFEMAGKTGTAQVHHISKEERASGGRSTSAFEAKLPWKLREHALFIAFAPVQMPRYAASIILEHGSTISHPHVQMVRDILLFAQRRNTANLPTAYPVNAASAGSADSHA